MIRTLAVCVAVCAAAAALASDPETINVHSPIDCLQITAPGDHLLV